MRANPQAVSLFVLSHRQAACATTIHMNKYCLSLFFLSVVIATAPASAADLAAIMRSLETDALGTANQLLALGEEVNRDPKMVHSFVQAARTIGREGHWQTSIELLERARAVHYASLKQPPDSNQDSASLLHTIDLAIASAAMQSGDLARAIDRCQAVVQDSTSPPQHVAAAYPLLIKAYQANANFTDAASTLHQAASNQPSSTTAAQLAELAIVLGSEGLQRKDATTASAAYQDYMTVAPTGPRITDAMLGAAWSAALGAEPPDTAAAKLAAFVQAYPDHRDAPHALRASATCLDQANQSAQASAVRQQLLQTYPHSEAATALLANYGQSDGPWPSEIRNAWQTRLTTVDEPRPNVTIEQLTTIFHHSLRSSDDKLWQAAVQWLIDTDSDGTQTDKILKTFTAQTQEPLAEHLAVDLIARADDQTKNNSPAASAAACRWAGANERWSMLALAADELGAPSKTSRRSMEIDRILAESLMQTQRPADAMRWWDWLIDQQHATDFATLLRGAETSVAHGELETATARIAAAKLAAGEVAFNRTLISILAAELAIRRARFDESREILSTIVMANDPSPALRPRAQWLIGETYFMQQRYGDAIDAYRRVDALDGAGQWAPAALLQAGKAFEKLGRSRDAAVCYTALLTRFSDWPHASIAQSRLATLPPSGSSPAPVLR